jgi:hypothetical protein
MRMTFGPDDEDAYDRRRDELGEQFAQWLNTHGVQGDPNDAGLLMDWKWSYADGRLDHWSVPDVQEFLFEWCPRKLSAPPDLCAEIPLSVAAFVEFLAHTGTLAPGSAAPSALRKYCQSNVDKFVREMGDPANFGMAKGLLGPGFDPELHAIERLEDALDDLPEGAELPAIAPVRLPPESERLEAVRASRIMGQLRELAAYCESPGRKLTQKGNLTLADARHLVDALDTGDDPDLGGVRKLQSSDQLPELSRLVDLAVEAGVVRRHRGRLVAVAPFAELDECAAHEKVVLTVTTGLTGPSSPLLRMLFAQVGPLVHAFTTVLLGELLRHGRSGLEIDHFDELSDSLVESVASGMPDFVDGLMHEHLEQLRDLGVLTVSGGELVPCADCEGLHQEGGSIALTAAGVPVVVQLLRQAGIEVPLRPEPADADASSIVDLFEHLGDEELRREVEEWFAGQPDPHDAAAALAAESLAGHRSTITAMTGIAQLDLAAAEHVVDVLRPHQDGPQGGLVLRWLVGKDVLEPESVDPERLLSGFVDFLAVGLDTAGPEEVVAVLSDEAPGEGAELLEQIWRLDHPRLPDVLDAIGKHHPVKAVAKASRKALMRHKSRVTSAAR